MVPKSSDYKPPEVRYVEIPRLRIQGMHWDQIADELGVSVRQIYKDRQHVQMDEIRDRLLDQLIEDLSQFRLSDSKDRKEKRADLKFSIVETNKLLTRGLLPKKFETVVEQTINLDKEMKIILDVIAREHPELLDTIKLALESAGSG